MNEEKQKILQMLDEGKINVEEAMKLLDKVNDDSAKQGQYGNSNLVNDQNRDHDQNQNDNQQNYNQNGEQYHNQDYIHNGKQYRDQRRGQWREWEGDRDHRGSDWDFSWISDLGNTVSTIVSDSLGDISDSFAHLSNSVTFVNTSDIGNGIKLLALEGKNQPVKVVSYEGDELIIKGSYQMKRNGVVPQLSEKNGEFSLDYNIDDFYSIGVTAQVPSSAMIDTLQLETRNSAIVVDEIKANIIKAGTKNSSIKISDTEANGIYCQTKNSLISLEDIEAREIEARTANSQITVDDVTAETVKLGNTNGRIKVDDSDIVRLYARTTNSAVIIDDMICDQQAEYFVDAASTNGNITLQLPDEEIKCKLNASTTNSRIIANISGMQYFVNDKNYVEAQSPDYDNAQGAKLNLILQTTNAKIAIDD